MLFRSYYKKELESNELLNQFIKEHLNNEVIPLFSDKLKEQLSGYEPFKKDTENSEIHFKGLERGIIHHNLKVVEMYYTRINIARLATLSNINSAWMEEEISEMVCKGLLRAKIDRISGIVDFRRQMQSHDYMNDWGSDIKALLNLVDETCHLINREHVMHA